jgi:ComF family protein
MDLFAPVCCGGCSEVVPGAALFCRVCRALLPPPCSDRIAELPVWAAGTYQPPLSTAITRFKYEGRVELAAGLAMLSFDTLNALNAVPSDVVLVPVPLHAHRLAERGYNQAALLASRLARCIGVGHDALLLTRTRQTAPQARASFEQRGSALAGAFAPRKAVVQKRVVLVDDVVTTGATIAECACAVQSAGGVVVGAIALARTLAERGSPADAPPCPRAEPFLPVA